MAVTPSRGTPGYTQRDTTSPKRTETIRRAWDFLQGLTARKFRITGEGGTAGQALVASDDNGNVTFSATLPSTSFTDSAETASQNATLVAVASGEYLATMYVQCTTAGSAGTLTGTFTYTDDVGAFTTANIVSLALTGTGRDEGIAVLRCSGGGIDFTLTVAGATGSPQYAAHISVMKVRG